MGCITVFREIFQTINAIFQTELFFVEIQLPKGFLNTIQLSFCDLFIGG